MKLGLDIIAEDRLKRALKIEEKGDAVMQSMLKQIQLRLKRTRAVCVVGPDIQQGMHVQTCKYHKQMP